MQIARYHPQLLAVDQAVLAGRAAGDADLTALTEEMLGIWRGGCVQIMEALAAGGRLAAPWAVETAADMLPALMRDEVVETLVVNRSWTESQQRELLTVLLLRTFVTGG